MRITVMTWAAAALLAVSACAPANDAASPPPQTPDVTPAETPDVTDTPTPPPTPEETPTPTPDDAAFDDPQECENTDVGFTISYPGDWWANDVVTAEDPVADIPACTYFAPEPVTLQPGTDDLSGVAVRFDLREEDRTTGEVISGEDTTVDGHSAVVREVEPDPQPGFIPEDARTYEYVIEVEDGRYLVATTDNIQQDDERYEESKPVLDAMMETIEID